MTPHFDIFRIETDGNVFWLKTASTLDDAKALAQKFTVQAPNGLIILDQKTGEKYILHPSDSPKAPGELHVHTT